MVDGCARFGLRCKMLDQSLSKPLGMNWQDLLTGMPLPARIYCGAIWPICISAISHFQHLYWAYCTLNEKKSSNVDNKNCSGS